MVVDSYNFVGVMFEDVNFNLALDQQKISYNHQKLFQQFIH